MEKRKRVLAILLSAMMIAAYMPAAAFAVSEDTQDIPVLESISIEAVKAGTNVDLADSDELLWGYLESELSGNAVKPGRPVLKSASRPRGDRLSGADRLIYDELKSQIYSLVNPESDSDSSATSFKLTFVSMLGKTEDYPIASIKDGSTGETVKTRKVPAEDAAQFIDFASGKMAYDTESIVNALLADMPYALYWYDKTLGSDSGIDPSTYYNGGSYIYFADGSEEPGEPGLIFNFCVAEAYQGIDAEGLKNELLLDSAMRNRAYNAAKAADAIISNPSGSAYDTLISFRDTICSLVDYDREAAADVTMPYGDPWQMINVFDGDPATKTVCEGYAKAFQYLVDNSFLLSDAGFECDSVSGVMSLSGKDPEKHMWNIIHAPDKKNYIADVTNCDEGTVGNPDYLFMKGCEAGGSVADGYSYLVNKGSGDRVIGYQYDSSTKAQFSEDELTMSETAYDGGQAPPDDPPETEAEYFEAVDPTCTESGNKEYWLKDGVFYADEDCTEEVDFDADLYLPALGHDWGEPAYEWTADNLEATASRVCRNDSSHIQSETCKTTSEITKEASCEDSGVMTYTAAFNNKAFWAQTKAVEIPALGHDYGAWKVTKGASCTEAGEKQRVCKRDGTHIDTRVIPALGHTEEVIPAVAATCEESGLTEGKKCKVCGEILAAQKEIPATGHSEETVEAVAPTCTGPGYTEGKSCSVCGETLSGIEEVPALGHDWGEWVTVKEPTYSASGKKERTCSRCGDIEQATIAKLTRKPITGASISGIKAKVYTGSAIKQTLVVKLNGKTLKAGTDYKLTYSNNKNVGLATVKITGIGGYSGSISKTFRINPKGTTLNKPTAAKKAATVKWKKQSAKMASTRITGYQIQLATNSKFTKGKKTVTVAGCSKVSKKVTGLKGGKKYYIRIRTYKTVNKAKYYSAWSKSKTVTTKK